MRKDRQGNGEARQGKCFNGAALFQVRKESFCLAIANRLSVLQWGRTLSSAESFSKHKKRRIGIIASMGPHSFKCGKRLMILARLLNCRGFNGAALFQVRKVLARKIFLSAKVSASMGPHSFKCGKLRIRPRACARFPSLQWGRTLSSAESFVWLAGLRFCLRASMGPHSFKCGKAAHLILPHSPPIRFNGAALFQVRKDLATLQGYLEDVVASMGPHSFKCGKQFGEVQACQSGRASMGPHSFKCGKYQTCCR